MPQIKLAQGQLQQPSNGGLTPTAFSASGIQGLRAPQINANAGNVQQFDLKTAPIQYDNTLGAAADFATTLMGSISTFQDRKDKLAADKLVMAYENEMFGSWTGKKDSTGNFKTGFSGTKGVEANSNYRGYSTNVDSTFASMMESASPAVQQKAAVRMNATRNTYQQRGASHNVKQLEFAEGEARDESMQLAYREAEVDPNRGWDAIRNVAGQAKSVGQRVQEMSAGATYVTEKIYAEAIAGGASEENAFKASLEWFQKHREEMPEDTEVDVASRLSLQGKSIARAEKTKQAEFRASMQAQFEYQGAGTIYKALKGGKQGMKQLGPMTARVMRLYKDPNKAAKAIEDNYKEAFRGLQQEQEHGYEYAVQAWEDLQASAVENKQFIMPGQSVTAIEVFINGPLQNENAQAKKYERTMQKQQYVQTMFKAENVQELYQLQASLSNLNLPAESLMTLDGSTKNRIKEIEGKVTEAEKNVQRTNHLEFYNEAVNGWSSDFQDRAMGAQSRGEISSTQYQGVVTRARKFTNGQVDPTFKPMQADLKGLIDFNNMYYDPRDQSVGFTDMLDTKQRKELDEAVKKTGKTEKQTKMLALSSLSKEAQEWKRRPENKGKGYGDFIPDFFSQQEGTKMGFAARVAKNVQRVTGTGSTSLVEAAIRAAANQDTKDRVEYDRGAPNTTPLRAMAPQAKTRPVGNGIQAETRPGVGPNPVASRATAEAEYALSTVPEKHVTRYKNLNLNTDELLALQMMREQRPAIDQYSDAEVQNVISAVKNTREFETWKSSQTFK